jgi:hypothetical protein
MYENLHWNRPTKFKPVCRKYCRVIDHKLSLIISWPCMVHTHRPLNPLNWSLINHVKIYSFMWLFLNIRLNIPPQRSINSIIWWMARSNSDKPIIPNLRSKDPGKAYYFESIEKISILHIRSLKMLFFIEMLKETAIIPFIFIN